VHHIKSNEKLNVWEHRFACCVWKQENYPRKINESIK